MLNHGSHCNTFLRCHVNFISFQTADLTEAFDHFTFVTARIGRKQAGDIYAQLEIETALNLIYPARAGKRQAISAQINCHNLTPFHRGSAHSSTAYFAFPLPSQLSTGHLDTFKLQQRLPCQGIHHLISYSTTGIVVIKSQACPTPGTPSVRQLAFPNTPAHAPGRHRVFPGTTPCWLCLSLRSICPFRRIPAGQGEGLVRPEPRGTGRSGNVSQRLKLALSTGPLTTGSSCSRTAFSTR